MLESPVSSNSARTNETTAEARRMRTSWSLNCSRISSHIGVGGSSGSSTASRTSRNQLSHLCALVRANDDCLPFRPYSTVCCSTFLVSRPLRRSTAKCSRTSCGDLVQAASITVMSKKMSGSRAAVSERSPRSKMSRAGGTRPFQFYAVLARLKLHRNLYTLRSKVYFQTVYRVMLQDGAKE